MATPSKSDLPVVTRWDQRVQSISLARWIDKDGVVHDGYPTPEREAKAERMLRQSMEETIEFGGVIDDSKKPQKLSGLSCTQTIIDDPVGSAIDPELLETLMPLIRQAFTVHMESRMRAALLTGTAITKSWRDETKPMWRDIVAIRHCVT